MKQLINFLPTQHHAVLFWIGLVGIVFYAVAPILFPELSALRQPELLPIYIAMLGLGKALRASEANLQTQEEGTNANNDGGETTNEDKSSRVA